MNPKADIWNVLHDGEIIQIQGKVPGDLRLTISIAYLRHMFSDTGDSITLCLRGCSYFTMNIWDENLVTSDPERIVKENTEILSTESLSTPVHVITTKGEIDTDFESFSLTLNDGKDISYESLCEACERYWNKWEAESKATREA